MRSRYLLNAFTAKLYYFHSRESFFTMFLLFNITSLYCDSLSADLLRFFTWEIIIGVRKKFLIAIFFQRSLKVFFNEISCVGSEMIKNVEYRI